MSAGPLRVRVAFHRLDTVEDGYGGASSGMSATPFLTVWGDLNDQRGRERVDGGALDAPMRAVLRVRYSAAAAGVTEADEARLTDGRVYNIRSIIQVDERRRWLEMVVERGVA